MGTRQDGARVAELGSVTRPDKAYRDYVRGNFIGVPEALVDMHLERKSLVGDYDMLANFSFGGLPYELVYEQAKLFADEVLPKIKA